MAFFPHLSHSLTQPVENVFLYSLSAWRLHTKTQISLNIFYKRDTLYFTDKKLNSMIFCTEWILSQHWKTVIGYISFRMNTHILGSSIDVFQPMPTEKTASAQSTAFQARWVRQDRTDCIIIRTWKKILYTNSDNKLTGSVCTCTHTCMHAYLCL